MTAGAEKSRARDALARHRDHVVALSRRIHAHPELGFAEHLAAQWIGDLLTDAGFAVQAGVCELPTAFIATRGRGELVFDLCAEYDALPEIGHACGHNLIAAAAVGAALAFAAVAEDLGVTVRVVGTPAEETGGGKVLMLDRGAFTGTHLALLAHPGPFDCVTPRFLAAHGFRVRYHGKEAHAALNPFDGVNAADALTVAQVAIGLLRQQVRADELVHGIVSTAGSAPNVIPALAEATYGIRAADLAGLADLTGRLTGCFEAGALATGARLELTPDPVSYAEVLSNGSLAELYRRNRSAVGRRVTEPAGAVDRVVGSTDFGNLSQVVPALHPLFDIGAPTANHHPDFAAAAATATAEQAMLDAALAMSWTLIDAATATWH